MREHDADGGMAAWLVWVCFFSPSAANDFLLSLV
jgi:hypothetical protein